MSTGNRTTHVVEFINYAESIRNALDGIRASDILSKQRVILIKPNLVDSIKFPVTTHRDCVSAIIDYIRNYTDARIIIAEGCGCPNKETAQVFKELGYTELAQEKSVELMDLNKAPLIKLKNPKFKVLPVCYLPEVAMRSFILSVPVLKAHSFSSVTLSLKNMLGFAPPEYYQGKGDIPILGVIPLKRNTFLEGVCKLPEIVIKNVTIENRELILKEVKDWVNKILFI